jgi:hypothetical protein
MGMRELTQGSTALASGDFEQACGHLFPLFDVDDPAGHPIMATWGFADYAEAAARTGRFDDLRSAILQMERFEDEMSMVRIQSDAWTRRRCVSPCASTGAADGCPWGCGRLNARRAPLYRL